MNEALPALEALLELLPTGFLLIDRARIIRRASARAVTLLRTSPAALIDAPLADVLPSLVETLRQHTRPAELQRAELRLDGVVLGYSVTALPEHGEPEWLLVVFQDITGWVALRDERDRLLRLATVRQVLPSVLHELRNPLASVTAAVELLIEDAATDELQESLHAVLGELRRMTLSLDGVGAVGRALRSTRPQAVDDAIREAGRIVRVRLEEARMHLRLDIAFMPLLPLDASVVRAIGYNLILNAMQACEAGCTVALHARLIDDGKVFEMTVVDNGAGMTQDTLEHCRELFFSTKRGGSGLGLALCDRVVSDAGGVLEIESVPGGGTSVRLRVPLATQ